MLKSAKAHCRSGYSKKTVTITVKRRHRKVKQHQLRAASGRAPGGGSGVTFPSGLPTVTVTPTILPTAADHTYSDDRRPDAQRRRPRRARGRERQRPDRGAGLGPPSGTLALHKDGTFTYTPAGGPRGSCTSSTRSPSSTARPPRRRRSRSTSRRSRSTPSTPSRLGQTLIDPGQPAARRRHRHRADRDPRSRPATARSRSTRAGDLHADAGFSGADSFTYQAVDGDAPALQHRDRDDQRRRGRRRASSRRRSPARSATPSCRSAGRAAAARRSTSRRAACARGRQRPQRRHAQRDARDDHDRAGRQRDDRGRRRRSPTRRRPASRRPSDSFSYRSTRARALARRRPRRSTSHGARVWYVDDTVAGTATAPRRAVQHARARPRRRRARAI